MATVIGVRFKEVGKVYYFDPDGLTLKKGEKVIVETVRGIECGEVAMDNREISDEEIVKPLKKLIRIATAEDIATVTENKKKEKEAFEICQKKIVAHGLEMKLVDVEYTFDGGKILFYFTADGRVDFRDLVKDLAGVFRTRIELRQIGVRDESKMLGGLGICGRPFCCGSFLGEFQPVSIKMAKEQGLSLNPAKISGACGRLMCCLKYEQVAYEHLLKITPKPGAIVETAEGAGTVAEMSLLTGTLKIKLHNNPDAPPKAFHRKDVKIVRDSRIKVDKSELEALKDIEG
ncbi:MAG: stage 0 sporulation family protein [Clostridia bacterium]|nr:stage 0 sporulation family protein [Clostridia bacterium]